MYREIKLASRRQFISARYAVQSTHVHYVWSASLPVAMMVSLNRTYCRSTVANEDIMRFLFCFIRSCCCGINNKYSMSISLDVEGDWMFD